MRVRPPDAPGPGALPRAGDFEATVDDRTILLCPECLEGRRDQDLESFGEVRFSFREL